MRSTRHDVAIALAAVLACAPAAGARPEVASPAPLAGQPPFRARAAAGTLWSPRIYTAGPWKSLPSPQASSETMSIASYIAAYKAAGYDFAKTRDESGEEFKSVLAAALAPGGLRSIEHLTGYRVLQLFAHVLSIHA